MMKLIDTLIYIFPSFLEAFVNMVRFAMIYLEVTAVIIVVTLILSVMVVHALGYDRKVVRFGRKKIRKSREIASDIDSEQTPIYLVKTGKHLAGHPNKAEVKEPVINVDFEEPTDSNKAA